MVRLVESFIDDRLVHAVAVEDLKGRRLIVATADLDTQNMVLWDMGAIARKGGGQAVQLFRKILVASASVPGIFPPVMIDVEANGRRFSEMHVDGSTINSFFVVPESILLWTGADKPNYRPQIYVLLNGKLQPEFSVTSRSTRSILERSYDTASKSNSRVSVAAIAAFGLRNGLDLKVSDIPPGANAGALNFKQERMQELFDLGRRLATETAAWIAVDGAGGNDSIK